MEKVSIYNQISNDLKFIHKTQDIIAYLQNLQKNKVYSIHSDIRNYINGNIATLKKDYDKAIEYLNKAIQIDEKYAYPYNALGNAYLNLKKYDEAIVWYNKAIQIDEKFSYPYNNLGNVYRNLKEYDKAIVWYNKAIQIDKINVYPCNGLGIVYSNLKEYDKAIEWYNKAIQIDEKFSYPYNNLGNVYRNLKEYAKAVEWYNKAIKIDEIDVYPYNGLGIVYRNLKEYDKAIEWFNKAIKIDEKFAYSYNGLGIIYSKLEEYDKAIEWYNNAIQIDEKYASPYNGLGNVYSNLKEYDKAIEWYNKAIQVDDEEGVYYRNLSIIFSRKQNFENAKEFLIKSIDAYKKQKDVYNVSLTKKLLEEENEKIKSQEVLRNEKKGLKKDEKVKLILKEIQDSKIDKLVYANKEKSLEFLQEEDSKKTIENNTYFEVLRRWNSYTPIVADNYYTSKGGGYFIKINERGIVIDPGFNFIDNFRGIGHKFFEISDILISHAHNDHTSDLESILTLLHKYNEKIKKNLFEKIAQKKQMKIEDITEEEVEIEYLKPNHRKIINLFITKSVFTKYSGLFDLYSKTDYKIHIIEKGGNYKISTNVWFNTIGAKHDDLISDIDSVGFLLKINKTSLVYTGDTGWSHDIELEYKKVKRKCKDSFIILIAHIGGFKEYEMKYLSHKTKIRDKYLYKHHLGRIGLSRINQTLKPDVCLISEFGEEFKGHRQKIAQIYQKAFNDEIIFLPADIGLKFCFKKYKFKTITEMDLREKKLSFGYIAPKDINPYLFKSDYSISYYYNELKDSEDRLEEILRHKFNESPR